MSDAPAFVPVRLEPGEDLKRSLQARLSGGPFASGAFVVAGIGSLAGASLRFAGAEKAARIEGDLEILTLSGTLSPSGAHLHASLAGRDGHVIGGHVAEGCVVRTTAEVLLAPLEGWRLSRAPDPRTGYAELVVARQSDGAGKPGS
ncbi:MAG: DNA-binding protein [Betaproteobacteria bacterium]|nr:DNA-binding protein [Betaproteobacteria bacterium]